MLPKLNTIIVNMNLRIDWNANTENLHESSINLKSFSKCNIFNYNCSISLQEPIIRKKCKRVSRAS